jgi:hypothetical protein
MVTAVLAAFALMFAFLVVQLYAGRDPALGGKATASKQIVRRIIKTRVIEDDPQVATGGSTSSSAGFAPAPVSPAPVTSAS